MITPKFEVVEVKSCHSCLHLRTVTTWDRFLGKAESETEHFCTHVGREEAIQLWAPQESVCGAYEEFTGLSEDTK